MVGGDTLRIYSERFRSPLCFKTMQAAEKEKAKQLIERLLSSGIRVVHTLLDSYVVSPKTPQVEEVSNACEVSASISGKISVSGDPD